MALRFIQFSGLALLLGSGATASGPLAESREATVRFTEAAEVIPNPERGFYRAARSNLDRLDQAFLESVYAEGYRLVYARIDLAPWRTASLPAAQLEKLAAGFAKARHAGLKLIVRAVYNYPAGETQYRSAQDAPLPIVRRHLEQLAPLWRDNQDVIAFVQAGFVGAWGEWHTSSNALTEPAARNAIKDALLAAVPASRFVQFRYPPYIREWRPQPPTDAASGWRIGFHNDCFLASATDVGTFAEEPEARAAEQADMDRLGDVAPFGGETCNPADDPDPTPRTGCADILREGARYNLAYLNRDYYRRIFHEAWTAEGCADEVARRMGYRLRLIAASHPGAVAPGERLALKTMVRNDGWARIFNARGVELVLRDRATGAVLRLPAAGADPRGWLPGGEYEVALDMAVPQTVAAGDYEVLIAFPDASPRLRADPRYAIRPANADDAAKGQGWDAVLGAFRIGTRIRVTG